MGSILLEPAELSFPGIYPWGLEVIRAVQGLEHPALTAFMKLVSALGTEGFYLTLVLFIYWCWDEKRGFRLGLLLILSGWLNLCLKDFFMQPRPFHLDPSLGLAFEPSYGFPSGHAQNSLVFWFCLIPWLRNRVFTLAAPGMVALIGFSRLYLGVHFPTDILGGWVLGGVCLGLFFLGKERIAAFFAGKGLRPALLCAAALAFGMNWLQAADPGFGGLFLGFSAGYALHRVYGAPVRLGGSERARGGKGPGAGVLGFRFLLGMAGAILLYGGLKALFPGEESDWYRLFRFIRYGLLGLWGAGGAPWVFRALGKR